MIRQVDRDVRPLAGVVLDAEAPGGSVEPFETSRKIREADSRSVVCGFGSACAAVPDFHMEPVPSRRTFTETVICPVTGSAA